MKYCPQSLPSNFIGKVYCSMMTDKVTIPPDIPAQILACCLLLRIYILYSIICIWLWGGKSGGGISSNHVFIVTAVSLYRLLSSQYPERGSIVCSPLQNPRKSTVDERYLISMSKRTRQPDSQPHRNVTLTVRFQKHATTLKMSSYVNYLSRVLPKLTQNIGT